MLDYWPVFLYPGYCPSFLGTCPFPYLFLTMQAGWAWRGYESPLDAVALLQDGQDTLAC